MNKKGFTLVELLAVIIILGVLALITGTTVTHFVKSAQKDLDEKQLHNIKLAAKTYYIENKDLFNNIDSCVTLTLEFLKKQGYIDKNIKNPSSNEKIGDNIYVNINLDKDNTSYEVHNNENDKCALINIQSASSFLIDKSNEISIKDYNSTDANKNEMFVFEHNKADQVAKNIDYRYIGNNPYNYVAFNNEVWRIIGVFPTENIQHKKNNLIKIVRNEMEDARAWNNNNSNNWNTSSLNKYLNGEYFNLIKKRKNMIENSLIYLGSITLSSGKIGNGEDVYNEERSNNIYDGNQKNTFNKISLMYLSDFIYSYANGVNDDCYNHFYNCSNEISSTSWMIDEEQWILDNVKTNNSQDSNKYFISFIYNNSFDHIDYSNFEKNFKPVLYLKENIKIVGGDGTKDKPYQLSM